MQEFGLATNTQGPFLTERDAVFNAVEEGVERFITGYLETDDPLRCGWYWALEEDYSQVGGNKTKAVNLP